jgi:hypothetical protein
MSIRLKIILALVAGLVAVAAATAVMMRFVHERDVALATEADVVAAARSLEAIERQEVRRMGALLDVLERSPVLVDRLAARDRDALLAAARPVFDALRDGEGITHLYFHPADPADGVLLRVHRPELSGDVARRPLLARAAATGARASGLELGRTAYALRVVQPWRLDGRIVGYVELGEDVRDFLARLGELSGAEYAMVLDKARLDREAWRTAAGSGDGWETRPELVAVETTSDDPTLLAGIGRLADVPAAAAVLGEQRAGNGFRARGLFPIRDAGVVVGAVVVRRDVTSLHAAVDDIRLRVVLLATLLAIALSAFVIFLLESLVFERLARMTRALEGLPERLARGEYGLVDEEGPRRADELGRFETFFEQALRQIGSFVADVRRERPKRRPGERDAP